MAIFKKDDKNQVVNQNQSDSAVPAPQIGQAAPTQVQPTNEQKRGTGFTNLNRIMQANTGNKLGQTVAGGITNAAQGIKSNVQTSQQNFNQEAQKNRLDTPEAIAKRSNVLGRFDENNFNPDMSKFQVNQAVTQDFEAKKAAQQAALVKQQEERARQSGLVQAEIDKQQTALDSQLKNKQQDIDKYFKAIDSSEYRSKQDKQKAKLTYAKNIEEKNTTKQLGIDSLKNILSTTGTSSDQKEKAITDQIADYEAQYGKLTEQEKAAFTQSEKERLVAENLPSEQEMQDFRKYQNGTYTGPKELQDFQSLLGQAQQTEDLGTSARSAGGRQDLLKRFVGGRDYNQGQQTLDNALLGQDKSSLLAKAAKKTLGAEKNVAQANAVAGNQAKEYINRAKGFGEETTKMIGDVRNPLSQRVDQQMASMQGQEAGRQQDFKKIQDMLAGTDASVKDKDPMARMGLALQAAQDAGYISNEEVNDLFGDKGLIQRAVNLGQDPSKLIAERLSSKNAVGIDRAAASTADQRARLSALDRLSGKTGSDVEFGNNQSQYTAGKTDLDTGSLADYIARAEGQKGADPKYSELLKQQGLSPLQQILAQATQTGAGIANTPKTVGNALFGADLLTGKDNSAKAFENAINTTSNQANLYNNASTSAMEGLLKLNIGGNSLANSPIGKQLQAMLDAKQKAASGLIQGGTNEAMIHAQGLRDLTQTGKLDQALAKLSGFDTAKNLTKNVSNEYGKAINNVGKSVSTALGGGKTGDWNPGDYHTKDVATGKNTNLRSFANKSSDYILNQILTQELGRATSKDRTGGVGGVNLLMKYYQDALKREGKA